MMIIISPVCRLGSLLLLLFVCHQLGEVLQQLLAAGALPTLEALADRGADAVEVEYLDLLEQLGEDAQVVGRGRGEQHELDQVGRHAGRVARDVI